jgi:phospholipid N-methyltransferase
MENLQETVLERLSASRARRQTVLFAKNFLKHPTVLGSLIPSSPFLINQLLAPVDWARASVVVEYGPGIGNITRQILKRMRPDAVLVTIEINSEFVEFLRDEITDPRLQIVQGSALDVSRILARLNLSQADYIVSGIPYSTLPHDMRSEIVQASHRMLHPEGAMLVYQFTRTVLPYLKKNFGRVEQDFALLNVLPARIFRCTV